MTFCIICFPLPLFVSTFIAFVFQPENVAALRAELIPRDSYGLSFYDPSVSKEEIVRRLIARSVNMSNMVELNSPTSKLVNDGLHYLMKIRLGTPPVDIMGIVDTGSDFTWIQCHPCSRCIPQIMPLFDPQASSSYAKIPCEADGERCSPKSMIQSQCQAEEFCEYYMKYNDESYSKGFLSKDTMRMASTSAGKVVEIPHYTFGCGFDNFLAHRISASAIIGLGSGPLSLVTQLGSHSLQRFSYCLVPLGLPDRVSHIRFGTSADINIPGTVTAPLVIKHNSYFSTLEALTIGMTRIEFTGRLSQTLNEGNILIDSGAILMSVPKHIYTRIKRSVTRQASTLPMRDPDQIYDLCYRKDPALQLPNIVANFRGANVSLERYNAYIIFGKIECLAFKASDKIVYGNLAQQDFVVGFDKIRGTISFSHFDCNKF